MYRACVYNGDGENIWSSIALRTRRVEYLLYNTKVALRICFLTKDLFN